MAKRTLFTVMSGDPGITSGIFRVTPEKRENDGPKTVSKAEIHQGGVVSEDVDTAALSLPRGNGKSWLAAHLLTKCLTPGDELYVAGSEYLLCAGSIEQARLCFRFVRPALEPTGMYRFLDSATRIGITGPENTRLRVLSSNAKTAMGIVGCPLLVADEPGSWEAKRRNP